MSSVEIRRVDGEFRLDSSQFIPADQDEVFSFFSDASNLERITPDSVRFEIVTPTPIEMAEGTIIDYRLKIRGIPLSWKTEITVWNPPHRFVDEQVKGPYRQWIHEHRFKEVEGGTLVEDTVRYRVPGGRLVHTLFVRRDVRSIFEHRHQRLEEIFARA